MSAIGYLSVRAHRNDVVRTCTHLPVDSPNTKKQKHSISSGSKSREMKG